MKRGKRSAVESPPVSTYCAVSGEVKARFRHQSLLQDYEDLLKETQAKRMKLRQANQKKPRLLAEVKFLRRKYKSLSRKPSGNFPFLLNKKPQCVLSQFFLIGQPSNPSVHLPAKGQSHIVRDSCIRSSSAVIDLNQASLPIGEDLDEHHVNLELAKADKLRKNSMDRNPVANDLNLSVCRDVGHGPTQVKKRNITWQDQVALRV
ncbi:hypothetical protein Cni_G27852 [Canna indica]|uniref:Uncharacterized protein n=1 Tax=Canna indica TaxID=4628 RepID=A0AAQ3L2M8_9LILI|nr:hypothetical protein Cni_G27852 [Canna indica]